MAEAAGLALAVLGAFNDAIQCYEYVQIARSFDQDFQTAILKLDIAKLRLSRWGHSVGMDDAEPTTAPTITGSQSDQEKAKEMLEQIVRLFEQAEKTTTTLSLPQKDLKVYDPSDLDSASISLHKKLKSWSAKRFKMGNVLKKAKWALYKEKHLKRLIEDTTELVNALIELFPAARTPQQNLCEEEGVELASDKHVSLLAPLVADLDPELDAAIKSKALSNGQTFNITFAGSKNYGLQQGYFSGQQTNNFGGRP